MKDTKDRRQTTAAEVTKRVNWYTPPDELQAKPLLFIAQIMARGGVEDIVWMQRHYSVERQRQAYLNAPPGLFPRRCWAYWGLKLFSDPKAKPYPVRFPHLPAGQTIRWPGF